LLISLRKEKDDLFSKGKVRKSVTWQRVTEKCNSTSQVITTWEQCSNKWKKLEEKYVTFHRKTYVNAFLFNASKRLLVICLLLKRFRKLLEALKHALKFSP